jgi:hypothetical protein
MVQANRGISYEHAVALLQQAYTAFNARNAETVLQLMQTAVQWPNGWEGGYVQGHAAVRDYWQRQWAAIDPSVQPIAFTELPDERIQVTVHQVVKDKYAVVLSDATIKHIYTIENGLVQRMEIA